MIIKKFNENNSLEVLEDDIYRILDHELEMDFMPYTDDEIITEKSKRKSVEKIIEHLKTKGLLIALDANEYNI